MKEGVQSLLAATLGFEKAVAFAVFVLMLAALAADVIGREVFGHGVFGAVKFSVYALIYCAMAGFGIATASGSHLRPKLLDKVLPLAWRPMAVRLGQFASVAILLLLAWAGLTFVQQAWALQERDVTLNVLIWPVQLALPLGFVLSALRHLCWGVFSDLLPAESAVTE